MIEIFTPDAWLALFGHSPSLFVDEEGYIYTRDDYYKSVGRFPCGKISYESGFIYGSDYNAVWPTPIAVMKQNYDVTEVYEYGGGLMAAPILYIKNNKIYTPDEYFRILGGAPSGYIKRDDNQTGSAGPSGSSASSGSSSGGGGGGGLATVLGLFLFGGLIYILTDEARLANAATVLALLVNAAAAIFFVIRLAQGKAHFGWDGKHFLKCLLLGGAMYVCGTAVFVVLGLGSNIGTGHAISDSGGDQLELAAMIMAIPFIVEGFILDGAKSAKSNYSKPPQTYYTPPNTPGASPKPPVVTTPPVVNATSAVSTAAYPGTQQCFCVGCRSRLRVPIGVGWIQVTCPKCHTSFQYKS